MNAARPHLAARPPLVVDLDGTLVHTDLLLEQLLAHAGRRPWVLLEAFRALLRRGRAGLKVHLAEQAEIDVEHLPYRQDLLAFLRREREAGRELALVSASEHALVERVARHLALFDWCQGTTAGQNLKGRHKAEWLTRRLPQGFVYAGDSEADLHVWERASGAVPVDLPPRLRGRLAATPVETEFAGEPAGIGTWAKALRLHQWAKNALIVIPLFLSGQFLDPEKVLATVLGFLCFGLVASAGYLVNDLLDLQADRRHHSKRERPLPAGRIGIPRAALAAAGCLLLGLGGLLWLSPAAAALVFAYLAGSLSYSFVLKRYPFVDLFMLASLFTLRLATGMALIGSPYSTWLLTFSMAFFFSLSAIKRSVELQRMGDTSVLRRGYRAGDLAVVQAFGVAFAVGSLIIFVLYLENDALTRGIYANPAWLWIAPAAILLWLCRLWAIAARDELHDDPVVFALSDGPSRAIAAVLALSVLAAHLL